jgi:DNA-binding NtrC family response regulator/pSer/pThr/pTyr-binding forkhead associated (FHA) protein
LQAFGVTRIRRRRAFVGRAGTVDSIQAAWKNAGMPELLLLSGATAVLRTPLHGQSVTVGRSVANDIAIPDDALPSFLCSFEPAGQGRYRVVDRGGGGVVMNGRTVIDEPVVDGATFRFGALTARFSRGADDAGAAAASAGQRTGILRTRADGRLTRTDLRLRLPGALGGGSHEIPPLGLRIGALPDNDLVLDDGFVSSFHAQLFLRGERLIVRDLDSTNGTFVNGVRVVEAEVPVGAELRFGKTAMKAEGKDVDVDVVGADKAVGKGPWRCGELTTADAGFARTFSLIEKVAPHDASVCIFGETGTGKELVAHALHKLSGRRAGPFVPLNCAAFPEELIESELFGHEKGAFTGADRQRKGAFEEADKGTLFLDEIGELPIEMQAKLLRVLETRAVRRLGGRGDIPIDVRIVCATHRDLAQHVRDGRFREDLLHRIYVIPVKLPSLRDRPVDVVHLARHFAKAMSPTQTPTFSSAAEQKLRQHPFPGNVRELRNVVQRAIIMGDGKTIDAEDVAFIPVTLAEQKDGASLYRKGMTMEEVEKTAIAAALAAHGSLGEAARALGVAKTTLWRKATAFGLVSRDGPEE